MPRYLFTLKELEGITRSLGLDWDAVLSDANLTPASKSRLKYGNGGRRVVEQVCRIIESHALKIGHMRERLETVLGRPMFTLDTDLVRETLERYRSPPPAALPPAAAAPALVAVQYPERQIRYVIVENDHHYRWYGKTDSTDKEIAEDRWVRLWDYRKISDKIISLESLAVDGPTHPMYKKSLRDSIGIVARGTIAVFGVTAVYQCSPQAVEAFALFDQAKN